MTGTDAGLKVRYYRLFLVSFAALALEVSMIRWIAADIHVFAYFKNLVLIACVLGLGVGCCAPVAENLWLPGEEKRRVPTKWFAILLALVVAIVGTAPWTGISTISLLIDSDLFDFSSGVSSRFKLVFDIVCLFVVFFLTMGTFDALGRQLGKELAGLKPLPGYTVNLLGSLAGVLAFLVLSLLNSPPALWLAAVLLPMIPLYLADKKALSIFAGCTIFIVGTSFMTTSRSIWSPYYRIDLEPYTTYFKDLSLVSVPYQIGTTVMVNHSPHQSPANYSAAFIAQHPQIGECNELRAYDLPYTAVEHPHDVLILGAGTGNDIAAALRHNAEHVDAVEIDPMIQKLGLTVHPEKPYESPHVTPYIEDARAFLARTDKKYDLIQFGLLDSQTALSTMSSVRLDNYLYTQESLAAATKHLNEHGIASLNFATQPEWLRARLFQLVKNVSGQEPIAIDSQVNSPASILLMWGPGLEEVRQRVETKYEKLLSNRGPLAQPVEMPTDDWPFLYQRARNIPYLALGMLLSIIYISFVIVRGRFRLRAGAFSKNLEFFFLGAGFLLLETRAMLAIAILFTSTWIVSSIVICIVLMMAILANYLVSRLPNLNKNYGYVALLVSLVTLYLVPMGSLAGLALPAKVAASSLLIGLPFLCSGLIFSRAFSQTTTPEVALGSNILGAIVGGCVEYLSTIVGVNGTVLLAILTYLCAWLARTKEAATETTTSTSPVA